LADRVERDGTEDVKLRAQRGDEVVELRLDGLRLRTHTVDLAEDLVELDEVLDAFVPATLSLVAIGEILDTAQHTNRQRFAALRAPAAVLPRPCRFPVDAAGSVAVGVILALFREELERSA
jgi:hypothetical protein